MKKTAIILIIFIIGWLTFTSASAQTLKTQLKEVEEQVENLVTAKDEGSISELALRIETFRKVIELSISETKDLKVKLLGLDDLTDEENIWREAVIKELNNALKYYDEQKAGLEDSAEIDLEKIKTLAADFKNWRDKTYLPVAERVNEFLLIRQEEKAIGVAERRWARINEDIVKLEKAKIKGVKKLKAMLTEAGNLIAEGKSLNKKAESLFFENYIAGLITEATSTATTTPATSTLPEMPAETATTTATTSPQAATSTDAGITIPPPSPPPIKSLVEDSLNKIKEAYRVFIEMSNLVRKLLM